MYMLQDLSYKNQLFGDPFFLGGGGGVPGKGFAQGGWFSGGLVHFQ